MDSSTDIEMLKAALIAERARAAHADAELALARAQLADTATTIARQNLEIAKLTRLSTPSRSQQMTLQLLWEEHRAQHANRYGYSRFCELYRAWEGKLTPTMRQTHIAGERVFVDYAGTTIDIFDAETGEIHACQLFVAVLGASRYTYAEGTRKLTCTGC